MAYYRETLGASATPKQGQDTAGYIVPDAKKCSWEGGGGGEVFDGEGDAQAGVLHADFDADGAAGAFVVFQQFGDGVAKR